MLICIDCAMFHANADVSGIDDEARLEAVTAYEGFLVVDPDDQHDFSWKPCDACRSTLGGARFGATPV